MDISTLAKRSKSFKISKKSRSMTLVLAKQKKWKNLIWQEVLVLIPHIARSQKILLDLPISLTSSVVLKLLLMTPKCGMPNVLFVTIVKEIWVRRNKPYSCGRGIVFVPIVTFVNFAKRNLKRDLWTTMEKGLVENVIWKSLPQNVPNVWNQLKVNWRKNIFSVFNEFDLSYFSDTIYAVKGKHFHKDCYKKYEIQEGLILWIPKYFCYWYWCYYMIIMKESVKYINCVAQKPIFVEEIYLRALLIPKWRFLRKWK